VTNLLLHFSKSEIELVKDEANTRFEPAEVVFEPVAA
jgi:hypothetical protein